MQLRLNMATQYNRIKQTLVDLITAFNSLIISFSYTDLTIMS